MTNGNKKVLHIPIGPTYNNNCAFCNEADRENRKRLNAKYTPQVVAQILDEYKNSMTKVIFTSGEPTLNPDLPSLIRTAKQCGYEEVSLTTNGRMLSYNDYCDSLVESGVTEVIVSIHGHTRKLHEGVTRAKGSFHQTVRGIRNISRAREKTTIKLALAVTLTKVNYRQFGPIVTFLLPFEPYEIVFNVVQPIQKNMLTHFKALMPKYSDVARVLEVFFLRNKQLFYKRERSLFR